MVSFMWWVYLMDREGVARRQDVYPEVAHRDRLLGREIFHIGLDDRKAEDDDHRARSKDLGFEALANDHRGIFFDPDSGTGWIGGNDLCESDKPAAMNKMRVDTNIFQEF